MMKLGTRVTTRRGKDKVSLIDGRWGDVMEETMSTLMFRVQEMVDVSDDPLYHDLGILTIPSGRKVTLTWPKEYIEDARANCRGAL